jgi:hypothetical protein
MDNTYKPKNKKLDITPDKKKKSNEAQDRKQSVSK